MATSMITRQKRGKKFEYLDGEQSITDKADIEYFNSLRIPPAWTEVSIASNRKAKILATGYDKAGRLQYIYHPNFRAKQEQAKFERVLRFARALPRMRRVIDKDLGRT